MPDIDYHQMYSRLVDEVTSIYQANQKRIHKGLWGMIIVLVLYLTLLFVTQGSKVIILLLWIMTMFALAAYLITIEYLNDELKKKLEHITQIEQDFGPAEADVLAVENLAKLRSFIESPPSLVDVIANKLEMEIKADSDAAPYAEPDGAAAEAQIEEELEAEIIEEELASGYSDTQEPEQSGYDTIAADGARPDTAAAGDAVPAVSDPADTPSSTPEAASDGSDDPSGLPDVSVDSEEDSSKQDSSEVCVL